MATKELESQTKISKRSMASSSCFNSALLGLEFLEIISSRYFNFESLRRELKFLRTFFLCARKWGNDDASLGALLVRIEDAVSKIAKETHPFCLGLGLTDGRFNEFENLTRHYGDDIRSFNKELNQWYINLSACTRKSSPPDRDGLLEFMDSLLENMDIILYRSLALPYVLIQVLPALEEKLIFLKNFIRFTTLRGVDHIHLGHLLTHIKAVAVTAAHYSESIFHSRDIYVKTGMRDEISGLLQMIKPIDPQVYKTYAQALTASKSSRQSHTPALEMDVHILEDFIHSLLSNLSDILNSDTFPMFSTKDQLQILYEGLISSGTILKKQLKNFDGEMWDLTGLVVCDAGLVICSLFLDAIEDGLAKEMDHVLFDLLERIKLIRAKVAEKSPEGSTFNFPKVDELGFIDFLLENLTELTSCEAASIALVKHQIQTVLDELVSLRSFLGNIVELRNEQEELQGLWNRGVELAYRVEFLIDSLVIGAIPDSPPLSFDSITEEIKTIKLDAPVSYMGSLDIEVKKVTKRSNHMPSERSMPIIKDDIVGFDNDAISIIDRLEKTQKKLQIIAIVGMPGLGKTTLAKKVYNDTSVICNFHIRAWCCISQVYDKKNLLLEILTCIFFGKLPNEYFDMNEDDLDLKLCQKLRRNRYLIVLDDVWDVAAWNILEASFPDDENRSRIILTSRHLDVAPKDKLDQEPHFLHQLTNDESWKLLKTKLFPGDDWPPTLCELGMQLVEWCKGLPLTIVVLAGILASIEQDGWKKVVENLSRSTVSSIEQCKNMLDMSYRHLPDELKPCLLYFGAFPEDRELTTKKLTWLWIAEGFVRKTHSKSLEDKAKDYLMHLISRSLVMVAKKSSTGMVKTCRIHDLLHEFCVEKAKEERFFQLLQGYDELSGFNEPHNQRRLCIYSKPEPFMESRVFCPRMRCLLFFNLGKSGQRHCFNLAFAIGILKLLRVLDLSQICIGYTFPGEIELLVQLRYLAIQGRMGSIPQSIANLSNLEYFVLDSFQVNVVLPDNIWNLKKLRHLKGVFVFGFSVLNNNLDNSIELRNLDSFSFVAVSLENWKKISRKFPNIRNLKCMLTENEVLDGESNYILELDYLTRLESLSVHSVNLPDMLRSKIEFYFPLNLRKLTISGFLLPWCKISAIGNLPNLEVLKLHSFIGLNWNMEEAGQFPKLRFLKLSSSSLEKWTASESEVHLPCLEKLVLYKCYKLREVPSCLRDSSTLQMIEVFDCCKYAVSSIKQIEEDQQSMGNEDLKVVFHPNTTARSAYLALGNLLGLFE